MFRVGEWEEEEKTGFRLPPLTLFCGIRRRLRHAAPGSVRPVAPTPYVLKPIDQAIFSLRVHVEAL